MNMYVPKIIIMSPIRYSFILFETSKYIAVIVGISHVTSSSCETTENELIRWY